MSLRKTLLYTVGLALALGGPISLFSASDFATGLRKKWLSGPAAATSKPWDNPEGSPAVPESRAGRGRTERLPTLAEVLRLDVTVEWVMQRWPRVSTGLGQVPLQGYRVSLMTGAGMSDVAGSLTYYFNARQQVQRITLRGTTGDPTVLVGLLRSRFHFARRLVNDPGLVLYEAVDTDGRPAGSLKIRSAPVIVASQPHARFVVDLAVDRVE